jgi:hypothetical protein
MLALCTHVVIMTVTNIATAASSGTGVTPTELQPVPGAHQHSECPCDGMAGGLKASSHEGRHLSLDLGVIQ